MSARKGEADGETDARIAPDPLAAVLPALAALGSIATIAAVIWVAQDGDPSRSRPRRKASVILRDLEADCVLLQDIFRRLGRSLKMFSGERAVFTSHFKFGLHGLKIAQSTYGMHQAIVADVARVLTSSSQNAFDTMCAIEDGAIEAPESLFFQFGDCQEQLNRLLTDRVNLKVAVETGQTIAERLTELVHELKKHRKD